jgi:hypothetical protein
MQALYHPRTDLSGTRPGASVTPADLGERADDLQVILNRQLKIGYSGRTSAHDGSGPAPRLHAG